MEKTQKQIVVVAAPGYNCIVNIGGRTLQIDAFTPTNLSELFDANTIKKCSSLTAHLAQGTLKYHEDSDILPEKQNDPTITSKRAFDTGSSLTATFEQKTVGTTQSTETTTNVTKEVLAETNRQISAGRKKATSDAQVAKQRIRAKYDGMSDDRKPYGGNEFKTTDPKSLVRKVTTDVTPEEFNARQKQAAKNRKELLENMPDNTRA
jgi:hypothetical protein